VPEVTPSEAIASRLSYDAEAGGILRTVDATAALGALGLFGVLAALVAAWRRQRH
jgi:hypothetical protein